MKSILSVGLVAAFAFLLVAGAPLMAATLEDTVKGKVTAFEEGKSLTVESGGAQKPFKITADTKIEGELAVGKEVEVWSKDGNATKIKVKQ
jgi:hypothetical protein